MNNKDLDSRINYDKIESEKLATAAYIKGYKGEKMDKDCSKECEEAYQSGEMDKLFNDKMKNS